MEVFHIHGIIHPVFNPKCLFVRLTFRAVSVATTIVTDPLFPTTIASIFVTTQSRCPAFIQSIERTHHKAVGLALVNILPPKPIDDMGNFKLWMLHYF
jgi:hypothetical protein